MIVRQLKYIARAVSLLAGVALAGCSHDNLPDYDDPNLAADETEYALTFAISLNKFDANASSRAGEDFLIGEVSPQDGEEYEDYVNLAELRVLFFDMNNRFIFEPDRDEFDIVPGESGDSRQWYLRFKEEDLHKPTSVLKDPEDETQGPFDFWDMITMKSAEYANRPDKTDFGFKVAVLANYPDEGQFQLFTDGSQQPIGHFAHCFVDLKYSDPNHKAYYHLLSDKEDEEGKMGVFQNWVDRHHPEGAEIGESNAEFFIREQNDTPGAPFDVTRVETLDKSKYVYKNIWRIWNFGNGSALPYYTTKFADDWKQWFNEFTGGQDLTTYFSNTFTGFLHRPKAGTNNDYGLEFTATSASDKAPKFSNGQINVPNIIRENNNYETFSKGESLQDNLFHFKAFADGTLRFVVKTAGAGRVGVHVGEYRPNPNSVADRETNQKGRNIPKPTAKDPEPPYIFSNGDRDAKSGDRRPDSISGDFYEFSLKVNVDREPIDIYLCPLDGTVQFYEIEFIEDRYLYDTDRVGIVPSPQHPIAMFGLQEFDPIGDFWTPGVLFNLSTYSGMHLGGYKHRSVSLLRSVAKVELLVPTIFPKPTHVYMRSMNYSARCNPIDIYTPTGDIWKHVDEEIANIREHGPIYVPESEFSNVPEADREEAIRQAFYDNTAWFHGTWTLPEDAGGIAWRFGGLVTDIETDTPYESIPERYTANSPHVFNSRVERSDYVRMIEQGSTDKYYRYLLYMPEKNIDDADDAGNLTVRPKVAHIELRFAGMNGDTNVDDNGAYRIYFTENGNFYADQGGIGRDEYEDKGADATYEWNPEVLKKHWPVMRNHIYRFRLTGMNQGDVKFEIVKPESREVDIPAFE